MFHGVLRRKYFRVGLCFVGTFVLLSGIYLLRESAERRVAYEYGQISETVPGTYPHEVIADIHTTSEASAQIIEDEATNNSASRTPSSADGAENKKHNSREKNLQAARMHNKRKPQQQKTKSSKLFCLFGVCL